MQQRLSGGLSRSVRQGGGLLVEFKEFILRGNVVSLAVAVLIATAFGAVVKSLTDNIITPFIGMFGGTPDFSGLTFSINESEYRYGQFINDIIYFLIIAAIIFFFIIKPMNTLIEQAKRATLPLDSTEKKCTECISDIPVAAVRCKYCTSPQPPASAAQEAAAARSEP